MPWTPSATVTVGGTSFTSKSLEGISITYGRSNVWEQPRAGYAQIGILNTTDVNNGFEINQSVVITVNDSAGVAKTVFTGKLTDITNTIGATGAAGETTIQILTAVAPFAEMVRKTIGSLGYAAQTDSDRMTSILTDSGVTIDAIDTPFVYNFAAKNPALGDSYTYAATYAQQVFGYIYETKDGKVGFANESHRLNDVQVNGYYDIPENNILWNGIQSQRSRNDLFNSLTLTYDPNLTVTSQNGGSIATYGQIDASIKTEISNDIDAQVIADRYVAMKCVPQTNLSAFTIMLDSPNVSNATIDKLVNIYMGFPIQVQNLPLPISSSTYKGFVEGWTLVIGRIKSSITLLTSDSTYSIVPTRWQDVDPTTAWNAVGATVQWFNYE